ncbi:MAG TPA: glycosyltransferase [Dermatophilaceae bacterium]|nr:glycosyltransferase [Dermatophilaceae bacterium]
MRVLCSTTAGDGHFGPLAVLAQECSAAGHEVQVAAPASFAGAVGRAGLRHVSFPDAPAEAMAAVFETLPAMSLERANQTVMAEVFGRLDAQAAFPVLQAVVADWRPDVVLREPAEFGSLAAAEVAGVPHAEVAIGVGALMAWARDHLVDPLAELEMLAGLEHGHLSLAAHGSPLFTMVPPSMDEAVGRAGPNEGPDRDVVRYRALREAGGGRLPATWGDPDAPLVYVTFGTVAAGLGQMDDVFRSALDALSGLSVRVLMTTGYAGDVALSDLPRNAHVERYWPQDQVMPLASAVVGHGGFGTTLSALSAGVPQVVVPLFTTDQLFNADAVSALGVGVSLLGGSEAVPDVAAAVLRVMSDQDIRDRAGEVAAQISSLPDPAGVLGEISRIAVGHASRRRSRGQLRPR